MRNTQVRTLLAGLLLAGSGAVLTLTGGALGLTEVWPLLLVAGAGLLVGVPRLRHALALVSGIVGGTITVWTAAAVLPAVPGGEAAATVLGLLALTAVTLATRGSLRLSMQLVGWAATLARSGGAGGMSGPAGSAMAGAPLLATLAADAATLIVAAALGLLLAQVTQLVGGGIRARRPPPEPGPGTSEQGPGTPEPDRRAGGTPGAGVAAVMVLAVALGAVLGATGPAAPARADVTDLSGLSGLVEHRQTIVRRHTADGVATGGSVVTRVGASGTGGVEVVLRDQAVRGLRSLTGFAGPGRLRERGAPEVVGRTVTHRLGDGSLVRTVAALDRDLPVTIDVAITLDGEPTTAAAAVGRSGRLEVTYTLTNLTVEPRELRHFDAAGRPRTVVRDVAVPLVGDLVVVLGDGHRDVRSDGATLLDGMLVADLVLAEPAGRPVTTVTWSASVTDADIPPVLVRVAPVALSDTVRGGVDVERLRSTIGALRDLSDSASLALTGVTALGVVAQSTTMAADDDLARRTAAILDGLLSDAADSGAALSELRALVEKQDERARAGDGDVHGLLVVDDVRVDAPAARPKVTTSVVYVLDVAGRGGTGAPGTGLRLLLAVALLVAVGLLGRAIDAVAAEGSGGGGGRR